MPSVDDRPEPVNRVTPACDGDRIVRFTAQGGRIPGGSGRPVVSSIPFPPSLFPLSPPSGNVVVGVVDTGLVLADGMPHPWLDGHVEFCPDEPDLEFLGVGKPNQYVGHGTFVCGLILIEAPTVRVRMIRALDTTGSADQLVASAIATLADDPRVRVINLSFSGQTDPIGDGNPEGLERIRQALDQLGGKDMVVVAAAGNHATDDPVWPAAFDNVISVGAVDETVTWLQPNVPPKASFSAYGATVDAYANGVYVVGPTGIFPQYGADQPVPVWATWNGTSLACATVAGRIADVVAHCGCSAREAAALVLAGPKVPAGVGGKQPTYVASIHSAWSLKSTTGDDPSQ